MLPAIKNCLVLILFLTFAQSLNLKVNKKANKANPGPDPAEKKFDIELHRIEGDEDKYLTHLNSKSSLALVQKKTSTYYYSDLNLHKDLLSFYVGYIYIGSPPQILPVVFDTGSGYTFLASKYCYYNNQCRAVEAIYNSTLSTSHKSLNENVKTQFGKGGLQGYLCRDVIAISSSIILLDEPIGEIHTVSQNILQQGGISGVVGLSFSEASLYNHTFFDGLVMSKDLTRNVIAFYYDDFRGQINFGYIDANKYQGVLNSHKVIDKYYWTLKLTDVKLNQDSLNLCQDDCKVVVDTGSSGLLATPDLYEKLISHIKVNPDCSDKDKLPNITIIIDDAEYVLTPNDYIYIHSKYKRCALNIIPIILPRFTNKTLVLGENFIKNYYTVFDRDTDEVHLGVKNKMDN